MRYAILALLTLALSAALPMPALANEPWQHVRVILLLDPATPRPGDTVKVTLHFTQEPAPAPDRLAVVVRPGLDLIWVELRRVDDRTLAGSFFIDRPGAWHLAYPGGPSIDVAVEGSVAGGRLSRPPAALPAPVEPHADLVPGALFLLPVLAAYVVVAALWRVAGRSARTPAASFAMNVLSERKVA